MEKLRIEADTAATRAAQAEDQVKALNNELGSKDTEISGLKNKIALLEADIQRSEKRVEEVRIGETRRNGKGRDGGRAMETRVGERLARNWTAARRRRVDLWEH